MVTSVASCVEDDRNKFLPDDSFGFNETAGNNLVTLPYVCGKYEISIIKSGKGFNEGTVTVGTSNKGLLSYNTENNTKYVSIPDDQELYSFSDETISFTKEDITKPLTISWEPRKIAEYIAKKPDNSYAIPVYIESEDLEVNEGRSLFILNLVKSVIDVEQKVISKTIEWESDPVEEVMSITVRLDKAIPGIDLGFEFVVDNTLVAEYNKANGTDYAQAPEGLVKLGANPSIQSGNAYALLPLTIDTKALCDESGKIKQNWNGYVVPVRLNKLSVDGIELKNHITYIVIKGLEPVPPQLFTRMWGLYTTSTVTPWYGSHMTPPSTGGPDRNIAMDDKYVYVSQSNGAEAKVVVYDLKTGNHVKDIIIAEAASAPVVQTHQVSCVRVIKNTSADVNGGKDILLVSSLGIGDDFMIYAYVNGIDAAPRVTRMESWRRLGDKFTISGTWQSGRMYFGDNDGTRNAVVYYNVTDGLFGESWGTVDHAQPAKFDLTVNAGLGEYTVHPKDHAFVLLTSTENAVMLKNTNVVSSWNKDPQLAMTFGYNFFSSKGKNYIAYFKLDPETHARGSVVVLNDPTGAAADFQKTLEEQDIAFTAPLQDALDPTAISPITASPYLGDCVVREINGEIYMAALLNGGGLSVFKMN